MNNLTLQSFLRSPRPVSAENKAAACARVDTFFQQHGEAIDAIKRKHSLSSFEFAATLYLAALEDEQAVFLGRSARERAGRTVIPLAADAVPHGKVVTITATTKTSFRPERLFVSKATEITGGAGAADWLLRDMRIDGKTQWAVAGAIPGDMFETNAIDSFVSFSVVKPGMLIELDVEYIGNKDSAPFYGATIGMNFIAEDQETAAAPEGFPPRHQI
jgi:hypothetical protein